MSSWDGVYINPHHVVSIHLFIAFFSLFVSYEVGMDVGGDVGVCYQSIDTDELRVVSHGEPRKSSPFLLVD